MDSVKSAKKEKKSHGPCALFDAHQRDTRRSATVDDAIIHFDETLAVEPLDRTPLWESGEELPETYPYAV
jgi:hypothetical protein